MRVFERLLILMITPSQLRWDSSTLLILKHISHQASNPSSVVNAAISLRMLNGINSANPNSEFRIIKPARRAAPKFSSTHSTSCSPSNPMTVSHGTLGYWRALSFTSLRSIQLSPPLSFWLWQPQQWTQLSISFKFLMASEELWTPKLMLWFNQDSYPTPAYLFSLSFSHYPVKIDTGPSRCASLCISSANKQLYLENSSFWQH